jgi:hypothetical protein
MGRFSGFAKSERKDIENFEKNTPYMNNSDIGALGGLKLKGAVSDSEKANHIATVEVLTVFYRFVLA